jgi:hypothetical protein
MKDFLKVFYCALELLIYSGWFFFVDLISVIARAFLVRISRIWGISGKTFNRAFRKLLKKLQFVLGSSNAFSDSQYNTKKMLLISNATK